MYQTWYQMTALLKAGMLDLHPVITDRLPMKDFSKGMDMLNAGDSEQDPAVSEGNEVIGYRIWESRVAHVSVIYDCSLRVANLDIGQDARCTVWWKTAAEVFLYGDLYSHSSPILSYLHR